LSRDQNFVSGFYTDFPQLILRSGIDPYPKNQPLLDDLVRKLKGTRVHGGAYEYSPENPLLITGAELKNSKSKTKYGIILNINDAVIKNDERFAYEKYLIKLGNIQRSLLTKEDGVAGMYLSRGALYSNYCDFTFSIPAGRVIVIDAKGV
jgi:hypothetical protein